MTFLINERKIKPMIFLFVCYNKINKREVGVVVMKRRDKINYYLDMAEVALERSTCIRRNFGAVIVANDEVIATGYNGAPRGRQNCCEMKECIREKLKVPRGERYELCRSVHAEQNAIISAERNKMLGSTLYLCGKNYEDGSYIPNSNPCSMCKRVIINAGIKDIYIRDTKEEYRHILVNDYIENAESIDGIKGY